MRIALKIQYDGGSFRGWQIQKDPQTVQGQMEGALAELFGFPISITGSGRTDSGVHALGQVAHFDVESSSIPVENISLALNRKLPPEIFVSSSTQVHPDFHSRFQANRRSYRYLMTRQQQVLLRHSHWFVRFPIEPQKLYESAAMIMGRRDFSSFCYARSETENMQCSILESTWAETSEGVWEYKITGDRFLHHMVRMLVGTMVEIARGKWKQAYLDELLTHPNRQAHTQTAPAHGLCLMEVRYPEKVQPVWPPSSPERFTFGK